MKLTWYGHSAFRVEAGGAQILIDPFLTDNPKWDGGWEDVCRRRHPCSAHPRP
jgi:L-ascorbate metabolism protein UlaG (beta-lactamase superfamily)